MVKVHLFAGLRERAGRREILINLKRPLPLKEFLNLLRPELPEIMTWLDEKRVVVVVNEERVTGERIISDGDEIGLMPPFSGGDFRAGEKRLKSLSRPMTRIQTEDFSLDEELGRLKAISGRIGGLVFFLGTARDFSKGRSVARLEFEHYAGPAERLLAGIRERALKQFDIIEASMIHRVGEIPIGGNIVLIAVGAEHRAEAFRACQWCINELKATVPIWKKETTPEGDFWVEEQT